MKTMLAILGFVVGKILTDLWLEAWKREQQQTHAILLHNVNHTGQLLKRVK
jgi:hypothetical protein